MITGFKIFSMMPLRQLNFYVLSVYHLFYVYYKGETPLFFDLKFLFLLSKRRLTFQSFLAICHPWVVASEKNKCIKIRTVYWICDLNNWDSRFIFRLIMRIKVVPQICLTFTIYESHENNKQRCTWKPLRINTTIWPIVCTALWPNG